MIDKFLNMIRQQAGYMQSGQAVTVLGKLTNYDPSTFFGMVQLYAKDQNDPTSEDYITGWLPLPAAAIGIYLAPNIGDLVLVHFQEASLQNGFIGECYYTGQVAHAVPNGEWWFMHSSGSFLKFTNDGKIIINGNLEIDLTAPTINITISGAANVSAASVSINSGTINLGDLTHGTLEPLLNGLAQAVYDTHTHPVIGGGSTDVPNQLIPSTAITTNVMAT